MSQYGFEINEEPLPHLATLIPTIWNCPIGYLALICLVTLLRYKRHNGILFEPTMRRFISGVANGNGESGIILAPMMGGLDPALVR